MRRKKLISIAGAFYAREKALGETKSKEMAKNICVIQCRPGVKIVFSSIKGKFLSYQNQNKGS